MKCVWAPLPYYFSKDTVKRHFLDINIRAFLGLRNFQNTLAMRVNFFTKCSKFKLHFQTAEKYRETLFVSEKIGPELAA